MTFARRRPSWALTCVTLVGFMVGAGCSVPPPTIQEWALGHGFREPRQTFETFRMAFRADLLEWEYRCLSAGYRARHNGLSQMGYRLLRDELIETEPLLKLALHRATIAEVTQEGRQARLEAQVAGHTLLVRLVREDFWEIWGGRVLLDDDYVPSLFVDGPAEIREHRGQDWFVGTLPLDPSVRPDAISEVRFGMEWKIDDFSIVKQP